MADRIIIENVPPFTGSYDLNLESEPLNTLEWRWMKKISGYLPLTVGDGLAGGDPDVIITFAVIALYRHGHIQREQAIAAAEQLADVPFDGARIRYEAETEEAEDSPPEESQTRDENDEPGSSSSGSGDDSSTHSEIQANGQSSTGSPDSVKSAVSDLATLPI